MSLATDAVTGAPAAPHKKLSVGWIYLGIAGVIITPLTLTSYDHGTMLGFKGFSAAMLGGLGSLQGALLGGLLLGVIEALAGGLLSSHFKDALSFVLLLLVLFYRPQGLLGKAEINKV